MQNGALCDTDAYVSAKSFLCRIEECDVEGQHVIDLAREFLVGPEFRRAEAGQRKSKVLEHRIDEALAVRTVAKLAFGDGKI